jgi:rare lipoprotein A
VKHLWATVFLLAALVAGCGNKPRVVLPPPTPARIGAAERGTASWYGEPYHGRRTSNGEVYDMDGLTAAHLSLPFGTVVQVRNLANDRTVDVRINDRGPFLKGRLIDLSREAARRIEMIGPGTTRVEVTVVAASAAVTPPASSIPPSPPQTSRPCEDVGGYAVQVGSFGSRANAQALARPRP